MVVSDHFLNRPLFIARDNYEVISKMIDVSVNDDCKWPPSQR